MKPLRPLLCLIALLSMASALHAQPVGARSLKDYQHRVWTQQDGAPDDISGMVQTTDGWLWVGGSDGLFASTASTSSATSRPVFLASPVCR